ncbi:rod shape-determining protein MreC [Candidatus Pelagibacter sp.]|nr:rod shape-determining protein MreC [Candidatus Pelagibacter sp.]MDC0900550.1 rod shape-determining protein MreC [Candidatus Pelagibacter sp.]MDC1070550.1 rod shape-determining protein MreC [Candidatus Pelagibacter sp.]
MATSRDDFVIAFRSAFLKKKDKQKFSLLTLLFLSILVIVLSNYNFKVIQFIKIGINEFTYRASFLISTPENKIQKINSQIKDHLKVYDNYKNLELELEKLKQKKLTNNFLKMENEKLRDLINESINSNEILARVLIDKESPFLRSIILNKGTKDKLKIGMAVVDEVYLVGKVIEVNYTNSRVLLLSDLNSKIPVVLEPIGMQAVVSGTGGTNGKIEYTKEEYSDDINNQEIIAYTSGLGGLFKPGLPVGKISRVNPHEIVFFSDFKQLEYVKIISLNIEDNN